MKRRSLWLDGAAPPLERDTSDDIERRDWDVAVVGAGIAGLLAALRIRESGREVCVLEARRVGEGTTSSSTVKVTSGHGALLAELASRHGLGTAVAYQKANDAAFMELENLIARLPEPVGWCNMPHLVHGSAAEAVRRLRVSELVATYAGSAVRRTEAPPWSRGEAWSWSACALVQPLSLARVLARLLRTLGVPVAEAARVQAVAARPELMVSRLTDGRSVRSREVVIASHAPVHDPDLLTLRAPVFRHPVIAVPVTADDVPASYEVDGRSTRPVRLPNGRPGAVVVGPAGRPGGLDDYDWAHLEQWARVALRAGPAEYAWGAQDVRSPDLLPRAGRSRRSARTIVVTGFNAWGFTNAMAAADEAVRVLDLDPDSREGGPSALWSSHDHAIGATVETGATLWWAARSASLDLLASVRGEIDLAPGEGRVTGGPVSPEAMCRTRDGVLHVVSGRCPHMGCLVRWNGTEESWHCPCHGSRFSPDGAVLEGPANEPLAGVTVPVVRES